MFECKNIGKEFGSVVAIKDASFSVEKGEIRAILGGNGSGKSTLAKIIGGSVKASGGELFWNGEPYRVSSPAQAKKRKIIITSQELSLLDNLTVEENLTLPSIPTKFGMWTNRRAIHKRSLEVLGRMGLADEIKNVVGDLPDNKKFLVEFAKALLQEPLFLIIDEITSALYREEVEIFKTIVRELARNGTSVLFISHRMNEIFSLCSTVTVMRNGSVIGTYATEEVTEDELLEKLTGPKEKSIVEIRQQPTEISTDKALFSVENIVLPKFGSTVQLSVRPGEIIGIAGLQGQGQSDFLRKIFGLQGPVDITLNGKRIHVSSPHISVREGIAFLSGDREREGTFSVRSISENMRAVFSGALGRSGMDEDRLMEIYGIKYDNVNQAIRTLSGGNQQKVVLARWTGTRPNVLLADDPTKGIDVPARRDVHEVFRQLAASGSAVILVSSDDEELVNLTKNNVNARILVMYQGQFVRELKGDEITLHHIIAVSMPRKGGAVTE